MVEVIVVTVIAVVGQGADHLGFQTVGGVEVSAEIEVEGCREITVMLHLREIIIVVQEILSLSIIAAMGLMEIHIERCREDRSRIRCEGVSQ